MIKALLLILLVIVVSGISILGYIFLPSLLSTGEPWENKSSVKRSTTAPKQEQTPTATPNTVATSQPSTQPVDPLQADAAKFVGEWTFTSPSSGKKHIRRYSTPRPENGNQVGDVADENDVNFAKYTVSAGNTLTLEIFVSNALNNAGEVNAYVYKFSNADKTFTLSRGKDVLSTWNRK